MPDPTPKIVGIIPARYGSTRLPGKALHPILGKPMIRRVLERCSQAKPLAEIWVATDDERIARVVESVGGRFVMTSPHHPSGTDRLAEAMAHIAGDIVVNIQGDQPFIDPAMIQEAVQPMLEDPRLPMATLMRPIDRPEDFLNPTIVKVVLDRFGNALYFSRSLIPYPRNKPAHPVFEHVGLYVYRRDFLLTLASLPPTPLEQTESLEQLRVLEHGYKLRVVETHTSDHEFTGFSVDTAEDIERAERMLRQRQLT